MWKEKKSYFVRCSVVVVDITLDHIAVENEIGLEWYQNDIENKIKGNPFFVSYKYADMYMTNLPNVNMVSL